MHKLIVITGQTATGKTKLALKYATRFNGELVNADSRQIYKHLDIITGKDKYELGNIPIHLYDTVDLKRRFSSYDFKVRAEKIIKDILKRGKTPIVVGGTYFYISHLLYGMYTENIRPDFKLRKKLEKKSVTQLQEILKQLNAEELDKLNESDRNNPRRLLRKIEVLKRHPEFISGSDLNQMLKPVQHDISVIGLRFKSKEQMEKAIRQRVENRLKQGAVEELASLFKLGYKLTDPGMKTNGCREISQFIRGVVTKKELIDKWVLSEVHYAKRQIIFMKRDRNIRWRAV